MYEYSATEEGFIQKQRQRLSHLFEGAEFIKFLAALAILPILPNQPRQNSGKELNKVYPPKQTRRPLSLLPYKSFFDVLNTGDSSSRVICIRASAVLGIRSFTLLLFALLLLLLF